MKIVIAGGTGYLGTLLIAHYSKDPSNKIFVLTRTPQLHKAHVNYIKWDGKTKDYWCNFMENTDLLINLTGKSVNCRYTKTNKNTIYESRLQSTAVLCNVIQGLKHPPKVFIQSSSATIYKHSETHLMTEDSGQIGTDFSMDVCKKWEQLFESYALPGTIKIITRTSIVMGSTGGALPIIQRLAKLGFGGKQGSGKQYISWVTERDYVRAISFLSTQAAGVYNICVPHPIKNKVFQKLLREKLRISFGLPTPGWLLKIGAKFIGTAPELVLKSRYVYPKKLLSLGFKFTTAKFSEIKLEDKIIF